MLCYVYVYPIRSRAGRSSNVGRGESVQRDQYDADHEAFRASVRTFIEREVVPHQVRWEQERNVDRQAWITAGKQGLIGLMIPPEFGGAGVDDYRYRCV